MPVKFSPDGPFNVTSDPMDLPQVTSGNTVLSGALTRCTNLHLDRPGMASTRRGTTKVSASQIGVTSKLVEQEGVRFEFAGSTIYENESAIATGLTDAAWTAGQYNAYNVSEQSIYATNGTDKKRITVSTAKDWGIDAPTTLPTIAAGSATGLTGDYNVKYTWVIKESGAFIAESNPSGAAASAVTLSNQKLSITCATPTDSRVSHIRIYRTTAGGGTYYYLTELTLPTYTYTDSTTDQGLGGLVETDHYPPPDGGTFLFGQAYNGSLLMLVANNMYFSKAKQPEYWPSDYYIEVCPQQLPLMAATVFAGSIYAANVSDIYMISGTGPTTFYPLKMATMAGTLAPQCFCPVVGWGIFHLGDEGIYNFRVGMDTNVTDETHKKIFRGETAGSMPGLNKTYIANCWMIHWQGKLYFGYPGGSDQYPKDVMVINLTSKKIVHYQYPWGIYTITIDNELRRMLAVCDDGWVRRLEHPEDTFDDSEEIDWTVQSADFSQFRKSFPRYARWDVTVDEDRTMATGSVLLDDSIVQNHPLTTSRMINKRFITTCTGNRLALRITGSGPADIYGAQVE